MSDYFCRPSPNLAILSESPLVAGAPLEVFVEWETPTNAYFIRNHFPIPQIDGDKWELPVNGKVQSPLSLTLADIREMPSKELASVLECAGNSRAAIQPPIEGLLWDHDGLGNARWRGIPVRALLEKIGVQSSAVEVLFEGSDSGTEYGVDGEMNFAMSLPIAKAMEDDVILAYEMNGEPLTPEHGFPLRLLVPGWYGMASVKWLKRIEVIDYAFKGFHQTEYYVYTNEGAYDGHERERVTSMRVKSFVLSHTRGQALASGKHNIHGVAWSGEGHVTKVEVSTDDGKTWAVARLDESESPYSWQKWRFDWNADQPGYYLLRSRATNANGDCQPMNAPWNFRGFANNSIHAVPVTVRSAVKD